jgi:ligand-binding sensor domain-containing protein
MKVSLFLLLGWISWLGFGQSRAQKYPITKYTTQDGLIQNQVLTVFKDSRGYVWCGTWDGASKFNGETFENFSQKEGLWSASITDIQEDKVGNIWFLNAGGIIARFDGRTFKKYQAPYTFTNLIFTKQNKVQVAAQGILLEIQGDTLLPVPWIKKLSKDITGYAYHAATDSYLLQSNTYLYSYQKGKPKAIEKGLGVMTQIHGDIHLTKTITANDIEHYLWNGQDLIPYLKLSPDKIQIQKVLPYDFVFTHQDQLYYLPANSDIPESLGKNPPMSGHDQFLNQATSSTLWLPTEKGLWGLIRNGFKHFTNDQVPYAWTVVEQANGKMLIGNYRVSLQEFNGKNLTIFPKNYVTVANRYRQQHGHPPPYSPDQWYYRALRDQSGACWLPEAEGIYRYTHGQWQYFRPAKRDPLAFCLAEDKKRRKIVAASSKYFYTVETQAPYRIDSIRGKAPLFDRLIMCNVVAPNGDYWFSGLGVERYDPDTKQFKSYTQDNGKLPTKGIVVLYFDWKGTLWAGGREMLCRYNPQKDVFEEVLQGHFNKRVQLIEQIDATHLMVGDKGNLHVLDLKHLDEKGNEVVKTFNHHNGFIGLEPGQLGSYRDSKGKIWITSASVLSVLDPQQLDLQVRPIQTVITQVNQERVPFGGKIGPIRLPFGENNVSIRVESLGEDKPYRSQFSYRLEEDTPWSNWQESPVIYLANLAGGAHTLQVRSRLGTLNNTASSVSKVQFVVSLYFWKSPNFYWYASLIGLLLSGLIGLLWWRDGQRSRRLLAQQREIEARERQMRLLQAQTIQSQMNPHFTSNALAAIQKLVLTQDTERANDNLIKMSRLTRAYLEDSLFKENHEANPFTREISLAREVMLLRMYVELMQLQYEERFDFKLEVESSLNAENHRLPPFLIQPFVENAIIHGLLHKSDKGMLKINFWMLPDETLVCKIEDDGIGREASAMLHLQNGKDYTSVSTSLTEQRKELLNQLGYQIEITIQDQQKNTGTVVTIQIGYV